MPARGKTLLDQVKQTEICAILAVGGSRKLAAGYVGCCVATIRRTALRDADFAARLEQAECKHELVHLKNIHEASRLAAHWRASAWVLERKYPERYGPRSPGQISPEQLAQVMEQLAHFLMEEIPHVRIRQRVLERLDQLLAMLPQSAPRTTRRHSA